MTDTPPLAEQHCTNCGSTQLHQDTNGVWHCDFCRSTFRADDPAMIVVDSAEVQRTNENVIDTADLLTYDQQQAVSAHLREVGAQNDVVIVVETVNTITENVEYYARTRAQELGAGDDASDNGIYILLVRSPRRVQVQTGNGIGPYLGSGDIDRIVKESIVPSLKAGDFVAGLTAGADALVAAYRDNKASGNVAAPGASSGSAAASASGSASGASRPWRYASASNTGGKRSKSPLGAIFAVLIVLAVLWLIGTNGFGSGGSGGGSGEDSSYDSGYDSSYDSGYDSGGGSDYGGGDYDSGSGGGSDW